MPAARVERWFLRVMLGVSVVAWLALLLAELGQFRLGLLGFLLAIGAFGLSLLVYAFRASPATPTAAAGWRTPALAATAGILLCAALFLPPYETAVKGGDATVYLNFGRQIAHHGALEFEDDLLRPLSIASRAELFLNRVPLRHVDGPIWTIPRRLPDRRHRRPHGHRRLFPAVSGPHRPGTCPRLAARGARRRAPLRDPEPDWPVVRRAAAGRRACRLARGHAHGRLVAADLVREALGARDGRAVFRDGRGARLAGGMRPRRHAVGTRRGVVLGPRLFCEGRSPCPPARVPAGRRRGRGS